MNYILIDTSYLIFYRYFALIQWWKVAKPEQELGNPAENQEFRDKFKKIMIESVETIKKNLKLHTNKRQSPSSNSNRGARLSKVGNLEKSNLSRI